jgi:hypothetical protein
MTTQIKDLNYFEEKETEYIRNCNVFDNVHDKHVYIVFEKEDEYGLRLFRGVAYNFNDAYEIAREKLIKRKSEFGYKFGMWLLVLPDDDDDATDEFIFNRQSVGYADNSYYIYSYDQDGDEIDSINVCGWYSRTEDGEQQ